MRTYTVTEYEKEDYENLRENITNVRLLDGTHINVSVGYKNLKLIEPRSNYLTERRVV